MSHFGLAHPQKMRAVLRAQLLRPASRPNRTFFLFRHVFSSSRVSSSEPGTTAPINPSATSPVSQVEEEEDDEDISFDDLPPYRADPRDPDQFESLEELFDLENLPDFEEDDITSVGHLLLHERRTVLKYLRAIETEVPQLSRAYLIRPSRSPLIIDPSRIPKTFRSEVVNHPPHHPPNNIIRRRSPPSRS
jgi:hypothetical protein